MSRLVATFGALALSFAATPALASEAAQGSSKAIWLALGVTFFGAFIAIFGSLTAAIAAKKKSSDK